MIFIKIRTGRPWFPALACTQFIRADKLTCKKKCSPTTHHESAWVEKRYSSYSFSTSALVVGEWSASRPGRALPPVPIVQEAGWAPEPVWTQRLEEKSFASAGVEPRSPGCAASRQTLYCLSYPAPTVVSSLMKDTFPSSLILLDFKDKHRWKFIRCST
jgi:hypothetical protein